MIVTYTLEILAKCPVDGKPDVYQMTVRTKRIIPVEDILRAVEAVTAQPAFQEAITQDLSRTLGAEVETQGTHSKVRTTVVCGSSASPSPTSLATAVGRGSAERPAAGRSG
jgi:GTP cyclohydrolase I